MSDAQGSREPTAGEPIEQPDDVDDVVGSANEGLADAEALAVDTPDEESGRFALYESSAAAADDSSVTAEPRDAARESDRDTPAFSDADRSNDDVPGRAWDARATAAAPTSAEPDAARESSGIRDGDRTQETSTFADEARTDDPGLTAGTAGVGAAAGAGSADSSASASTSTLDDEPASASSPVSDEKPADPWFERADETKTFTATEPAVTSSEPAETTIIPSAAPQPIFVQAPEAPRPHGNRGAAGAIGLLAAIVFGVLYFAAWLGLGLLHGDITVDTLGTDALAALTTWSLWVPVVIFFIAFWLLGAIINRGRWGAWVVFGLLVGVVSYGGHLLGQLFQAPFWMQTASESAELVEGQLLAPLAIVAFVIGRELTIWFGAWVARRGARMSELNAEETREYERTIEAGPRL